MASTAGFVAESGLEMKIIPAPETIAELERKAAECEEQANNRPGPEATELREKAKQLRGWIKSLVSGKWIP
jgi:hypothetical protein